ncbi:MAG: MFS transporter, partial [Flavobacteriales bacterium]
TILYSVFTTSEYPPTKEELEELKQVKSEGTIISRTWKDITEAVKEMPLTMKQLIPVKFFTWYAMFCYWQYLTSGLSLSLYDTLEKTSIGFEKANVLTGQVNGTYNIICFALAFALVPLARKIGTRGVHFGCMLLGGIGILSIPYLSDTTVLFSFANPFGDGELTVTTIFLFAIGLGIAWASMLAMPYQLLTSSLPKGKVGVYMGIFNMFIVIPMIIQIFSMQYFVYDLLGSNPINVLRLAGVFLIVGGIFTLFVKLPKKTTNQATEAK